MYIFANSKLAMCCVRNWRSNAIIERCCMQMMALLLLLLLCCANQLTPLCGATVAQHCNTLCGQRFIVHFVLFFTNKTNNQHTLLFRVIPRNFENHKLSNNLTTYKYKALQTLILTSCFVSVNKIKISLIARSQN